MSSSDSADSAGVDSAAGSHSGTPDTATDPAEPLRTQWSGALEAEVWATGAASGAELGSRVVWLDGAAWASAPGGEGAVYNLQSGTTFSAGHPDAHLGVAMVGWSGGVLAGAWARADAPEGEGAVYLLDSTLDGGVVEDDLAPVVVVDSGALGLVLLGGGAGETPDGWALGRPKSASDRGTVWLMDAAHTRVAEWTGESPGNLAGGALARADLDGDGLDELIVGAWGRSGFSGSVYAISAPFGDGGAVHDAGRRWDGDAWALAGFSLAAGDTDGDGLDDIVVGAFGDTRAGSGAGAFTVVSGSAESGRLLDQPVHRLGDGPDAHFSAALAVADLDGDGCADIAAGAPDQPDGGQARVYYGPVEGSSSAWDAEVQVTASAVEAGLAKVGGALALDPDAGWLVGAPASDGGQGRVLHVEATPLLLP